MFVTPALPHVSPNHSTAPDTTRGWLPSFPVSRERRRLAYAEFATALLLVLTLVAVWFAFQQQPANGLGTRAATGLASDHYCDPAALQRFCQSLELGRFADPLPAFQGNEPPPRH